MFTFKNKDCVTTSILDIIEFIKKIDDIIKIKLK